MERDPNDLNASTPGTGASSTSGTSGAGSAGGLSGSAGTPGASTGSGLGASTGGYGGGAASSSAYGSPAAGAADRTGLYGSETAPGADQGRLTDAKESVQQHAADARERLADVGGQARERLGDAGERARELKQNVERTLADRLEAGAQKLRARGTATGSPAYAGAPAAAAPDALAGAVPADQIQEKVAGGMQATADWLRNGDLQSSIETQARTNPGRTLLVALGVGYLLGKALRR